MLVGINEDLIQMRKDLGHGTERRPGERTVSLEEDLAAMREASQPPETTTRHSVGATAFGIGAGIALAPFGPAIAIAGATYASGVGEAVQNEIEKQFDMPTKPKDAAEELSRIGTETVLGTFAEGGGRLLKPAGRAAKILFFSPRTVTPEAREAMEFLTREGSELPLQPAKATESFGIDMMHNIAEHSFTGGQTMQRFASQQNQFMTDLAESMVNQIGEKLTPEQAGALLIRSADANLRETRAPAKVIYNTIKDKIEPKPGIKQVPVEVDTGLLGPNGKPIMRTVMQEKEVLVGGLRTNFVDIKKEIKVSADLQKRLAGIGGENTGGNLLDRVNSIADKPYVSDLMEFRTTLDGIIDGLKSGITTKKDPIIRIISKLRNDVSRRMSLGLRNHDLRNGTSYAVWKSEADIIYRHGNLTYNNKVIRQLAQKMDMERTAAPERVVKGVFAPQALTRMQTVKRAVTPGAWAKIARQGMDFVLQQSTKDGLVIGAKLQEQLIGKSGLGQRGLVEAVGPIEAQRWLQFANALKIQQGRQAQGAGSVLIQLKQPGAVVNAVEALGAAVTLGGLAQEDSNSISAGGLLILGLPYLSAKIMTNPRAATALIDGMKINRNSPSAAGIITRLLGALVPRTTEKQPSKPTPVSTALAQTGLSPFTQTPFKPAIQR